MDIYSSKLSPAVDYGAGAFLLLIAILSIVGNFLVLLMAYKRSSQMKPAELLSVNLAVTDLGAAVSMYPLAVASSWNHSWLGGDATCIYYGWMGFFFGVASVATLTVMAVVRFTVSMTLQSHTEKITKRTVQVMLAGTWLYALLWAVFPLVGWGAYGPEPFGLSCTLAWAEMKEHSPSFVISMFAMNLAMPALIIVCCYFGITLRLHLSYKSLENGNFIQNRVKMQRRLMLIAVLISAGFIGCWTPYGIVSLWSIYSTSSITPHVSMLPCLFAKTSTVYNPLIYYIFSKSFKQEVKQFLHACIRSQACRGSQPNNLTENTVYMVCEGTTVREDLHMEHMFQKDRDRC
ncbi:opsin-5-like [Pangasianodon hypophthalmus]|uniref:opsin-5-like n=1 Tax=Pangasianodon hypophthalmus TaxID=310915 RepID=UPI000EFE8E83|nr:opsin-5-like [Pangasianodon hypophthalmus]